ncbi:hypothetical protein QBC46DRAFT_177280 [Diplogelasinospora grovesii]|uniref:FAD/NAD(P)-binding domain-containing protein n=1 Tax=Diplogelasinospora grovesii TaxID=303347 RepID=A0AAN6N5K4_9PEZI|nr:hypothetical protein QBC46DRAFT_177280 [Diplogelasinospora grovesii]
MGEPFTVTSRPSPSSSLDSSQRVEPGSTNLAPYPWPATTKDVSVDADKIATSIISSFNSFLASKDYGALSELFVEDGFWRDHVALSWDLHTLKGRSKIQTFLRENGCNVTQVDIDRSSEFRKPQVVGFAPAQEEPKGIQLYTKITTKYGSGRGIVRLAEKEEEGWKIWTFFTTLEQMNGHEEPLGVKRERGVKHGANPGRKNWMDRRREEVEFRGQEPEVLIIGAGQGGLTAHARLKMLGVPTLIIDRNDAIGDNWRKRYHQLVLHDPVWYDHMPYIKFPEFWPVFTPKDKLAEWFDCYAKLLELNVWMKSELQDARWDERKKEWTVAIKRTRPDGQTETRTLHPKHIVQATGASGGKNLPKIKGIDGAFKGDLLCHSSEFPGAKEQAQKEGGSKKKRAIVVGACNSSHDICQDYYEKGYDVTMVQRSSTCVVSSEAAQKILLGMLYEEGSPPMEDGDIWAWGWPSEVFKAVHIDLCKLQVQMDKKTLDGLEKAGFKLDRGVDNSGLFMKYLQRGGGYYIDVGTSQLIIDGKVRIKQGQEVTEVTERGLRFADGEELEADEIVFATGFENMRTHARKMFGDEVADRVGDVWGWNEEGEMRTIWKSSGHPGLWFMGGNMAMCRYYSRVLALQVKARLEGLA